jgi:hypothetical protein
MVGPGGEPSDREFDVQIAPYEGRENTPVAFREKDELDWWVFGTYGLAMNYAQEFELGLSLTIAHFVPELQGKTDKQLLKLWKAMAGRLLADLRGKLPAPVFEDLERLVEKRNWLAHNFFHVYSNQRLRSEGRSQEAVHRLERLAQDFKEASMGLLALRTRITPGLDSEEKIEMLWATHGSTPSIE